MKSPLVISFLAAVVLCTPCFAGYPPNPAGSPTPFPPRKIDHHHTLIDSISADSITYTDSAGSHTFKIVSSTEITFKGEDTTVDKLATGMRVTVTPDAVSPDTATVIAADDPPRQGH